MVSTRQMSITTVGPEMGATNVVVPNASNRNTSNSIAQQNGSTSTQAAARQQSNTSATITNNSNSNCNEIGTKDGASNSKQKQLSLQDMPFEILDKILSYVSYKQVSNVRLVSTQMNQICLTALNSTFSKLQTQLMKRFQNIKKVMPRRESARRSHPLSNECDIVETCCMRLSLLQMAFGRYIEHKHCCFFPGAILDEVYNVINYIRTTPNLGRPYKITEELIDLSTMAMEYFKDHLEPSLPQFGLFSKDFFGGSGNGSSGNVATSSSSSKPAASTRNCFLFESNSTSTSTKSGQSSSMPSPPQSNMVLRKGIRKIKQGMKKYNNQLTVLRSDLRFCKRKSTDQTKQITELQNMLADQQKQTLEYANRLDENDKKSEEMSRKISTLLQELNKCKIELHYWRSKSPATPICNNCGQTTLAVPPAEDILALMNQSINSDDIANVTGNSDMDLESDVQNDLTLTENHLIEKVASITGVATAGIPSFTSVIDGGIGATMPTQSMSPLSATVQSIETIANVSDKNALNDGAAMSMAPQLIGQQQQIANRSPSINSVISTVGTPRFYGKRKADEGNNGNGGINNNSNNSNNINSNNSTNGGIENGNKNGTTGNTNNNQTITASTSNTSTVKTATNIANSANNSNISDNCNKKARRVQNKIKCQTSNVNIKTRNK